LFDAAVEAAKLRFRPILMTAFSFILGVLPLVVATGAGAEARVVMGMALLGGMTLATMLGVFFYPMLFVFIGKIAGYEKKRELQKEQTCKNKMNSRTIACQRWIPLAIGLVLLTGCAVGPDFKKPVVEAPVPTGQRSCLPIPPTI
jgi:predicted RND superfamily exporter protein